ncbi:MULTISPECIES: prepilin-type N-terminal cleavage/methylation domain-containing protein [unclassified Lentimonas]|uniref:prepilin-type N-terminal cleavage/methylation domain-containing protein n=1 Tax=unclassified Lentimonas TaxID=2630993 RepID=UPI0013242FE5|nr:MULTISPECIES: prepilin-type N-terminal cleavage/methylation domain-containing protein [unclassified Lentimonas]CAA6677187.1 Unannotated [Lentimonas sp. CC4]CAA6686187.1 Unannotated [Lentimonas sp. CC6]CAA7074219.1 Unannotated [Lentimonas sp. CC4]CAA7171577.1 Unannotated [Lentimonas sp. CC21]CAA7183093.1 Unannotated [Lentimonas sp. CC8]
MFSDYPPSELFARKRSTKSGFTLIELLMVIAVIMVLAGITFGISRGVQNAQARTQAKAELAVISQALEAYKSTYGDYPWAADGDELAQALMGWMKFNRTGTTTSFDLVSASEVPATGPKSFIDPSKMEYTGTLPSAVNVAPTAVAFQDPWGTEYVYKYKTGATASWDNFGFVLYSKGPDGTAVAVGADGVLTPDNRKEPTNIDNIYSGE